jgi:hypothetical protein
VKRLALLLLACAACGTSRADPGLDTAKAAKLFDLVPIDTDNGLSGIAIDDDGAIWTESERDLSVYRIVLDGTKVKSSTRYAISGAPEQADLEAVAWLGPGKLAFGTEGQHDSRAQVSLADIDEKHHTVAITKTIDLPADQLGLEIKPNDGVEGLCGRGDIVIAAIESSATDDHGRWAPIVRMDLKSGTIKVAKLALTSDKGKLSAVDCLMGDDGTAQLVLIERHFSVTRILRADLPKDVPARIEPKIALDLGPVLNSSLNLEGLGIMKDGRIVAVVDNQYDRITGPNELLVFKKSAVP